MIKDYIYQSGFGNEFASEDPRCPGALPKGRNNPQKVRDGSNLRSLLNFSARWNTGCTRSSSAAPPSPPQGRPIRDLGCTELSPRSNIGPSFHMLTSRFCKILTLHDLNLHNFTHSYRFLTTKWSEQPPNPNQMRWKPFDIPEKDKVDWVDGLHTVAGELKRSMKWC